MKHNKLRLGCALLVALFLLGVLVACSGKVTPITAAEFAAAMENKGYAVKDYTDNYPSEGGRGISACLMTESDGRELVFFELDNKEKAKAFYAENKPLIEQQKQAGNVESTVTTNSRSVYKLKTASGYYVLAQVGPTVLLAYSGTENASALDELIQSIGY